MFVATSGAPTFYPTIVVIAIIVCATYNFCYCPTIFPVSIKVSFGTAYKIEFNFISLF